MEDKIVIVELDDDGQPSGVMQFLDLHEIARGECGVVLSGRRGVGLFAD